MRVWRGTAYWVSLKLVGELEAWGVQFLDVQGVSNEV